MRRAQGIRARNWRRVTEVREAVQKGERPDFSAENLAEYPVPEWLKQDYRLYTVCMANRGNSTSFPEFEGMTFSERQELAKQLYFCLVNHRGEPIYSKSAMEKAYRSLYGSHEPDQFQFSV